MTDPTPAPARPAARRRPITRLLGGLTGLACVTLLAGCFSTPATPAPDQSGQRIALAMLQPPRSGLTPLSDDAFKLSRWATAETLIMLDPNGEALPGLATEWKQTSPTTWVFTIRQGVKFHDGTELTPAQVEASLTAATKASPKPRILDGVNWTIAHDATTVTVTSAEPDPLVPQRLSSPQLVVLAAKAYEGKAVSPVGTGTGPFELTAVNGTSGATLQRFDGYWGDKAVAAGIDVNFVPEGAARAAALRTGTAQVVEAVPVGQAASVDQELIHEVPMPRTNTLYLNTKKGPFADPAVRAAARAAIDRARLVDTVYEGRADIAEGLLGPALPWMAAQRTDAYKGLRDGHRAEPAKLDKVKITLGTFTDRAELPEVAVLLEQQLEAVGFEVTQDVREYQYIEADALDGDFDAFILSRATVLDSGDPVAYLYSDFACEGSFNIAQFCDKEVDAALKAAAQAPAGDQRRAAIAKAEALILGNDAAVPMLHERVIQGEAAGVTGVERDPRERALITARSTVGS